MFYPRFLSIALVSALACTVGPRTAHADIYTWTDASGRVNVSNLPPPEDARITRVIHEVPKPTSAISDSAREAARLAEVRALSERVQQLEAEANAARYAVPPDLAYARVSAPPPPIQFNVTVLPPAPQYNADTQPQQNWGCDPSWAGCAPWWGPGFFPAPFVVVRAPAFRRFSPFRGDHPFHGQKHAMASPPSGRMTGHVRKG